MSDMLRILTGSAFSDLSSFLTQEMVNRSVEDFKNKIVVIVPEQFTLQEQRRVVAMHPRHACMNIDVVSFDRLARVVLSKLGKNIDEAIDDLSKSLIIRKILEDSANDLKVYKNKISMQGFVDEVRSLFCEFRQYGIDDNMLFLMQEKTAASDSLLYAKLDDIRLIYKRFNEEIDGIYVTPEEVLDMFARYMSESDFLDGSYIYLDGFTGFTPIQYKIIKNMLGHAREITCSVTIPSKEINSDHLRYSLFALPSHTITRLKQICDEAGQRSELICVNDDTRNGAAVYIAQCSDVHDEICYCAQEILNLVNEKNARYRDIAVLVSDPEEYNDAIARIFKQANISTFMDHKSTFDDNMLVRFIISALEIAQKGMHFDQMFSFFKTYLCNISPDETALLENYCLEFNIRGRLVWESSFDANRNIGQGQNAWDLDTINDIRKRAQGGINRFYSRTCHNTCRAEIYCGALKNLLKEYDVEGQIKALASQFENDGDLELSLEYSQIYDKTIELIDKIERIMGGRALSVKEFKNIFESGIADIKISVIPPAVDSLIVGDLTRTRLDKVSYVFFLGMNENLIPNITRGSVLFTEKERCRLRDDFEMAPTAEENILEQRYYLYLIFNKPQKELYLTYSNISSTGEISEPSGFLDELDELMPHRGEIKRLISPAIYPLWKSQALRAAASDLRSLASGESLTSPKALYLVALNYPDILRKYATGAVYTNKKSALDKQIADRLYGNVLYGSVSRYETYYTCPYRHFLRYGLGLEKRREYELKPAELGTIYHSSLEKYSIALENEGLTFRDVTDEKSHLIIEKCIDEAIAENNGDILDSCERNKFLKSRIRQVAERTTDTLREHIKAGLFDPKEYEFCFEERLSENVVFRGKIDRVDIYDDGDIFVKIIDYKSGDKKFKINDIYSGIQLQLTAYMSEALKDIKNKNPQKNVRAGGLYFYHITDRYEDEGKGSEKKKMSGLVLADEHVMHAMDQSIGSLKDKSDIISTGQNNIANDEEFASMIDFVNEKIRSAGANISSGDISLSPCDEKSCSYCDYKDICRFEDGRFGVEMRKCETDTNVIRRAVYGRD